MTSSKRLGLFGFLGLFGLFGHLRRAALLVLALLAPSAWAGGPRFVGGPGYGNPGQAIGWATTDLLYYTDPGSLNASVNNSQADSMVAAAAAVWNVPTSSLTLSQGGHLAEHVSSANAYSSGNSVTFPADVQATNEANIPVAIIYDTDGSVTDLLLGSGASNPAGCRQNAVVGDVDDLGAYDAIHHATLILNGRCLGPAPEQLTQMQFQLARAFGRILGLAWSQTNDNVFTAQSTITTQQRAFWPLMHPIDVICGNYTYQCMTNPFTLRVDDLNSLSLLYPVPESNVPAGKQASDNDALRLTANVTFPTGQGMAWMNYTTHRFNSNVLETWQTTSGVTGQFFRQALPNPVSRITPSPMGTTDPFQEGLLEIRSVPLNGASFLYLDAEPINPLYMGEFALGMYVRPPVTPSGTPPEMSGYTASWGDSTAPFYSTVPDAPSSCAPGADGAETSPASLDPSGFQAGLLCGWGHFSWFSVAIAAGHSWTFEVTATNEAGNATLNKVQPVLGVWKSTDAPGTLPTVAATAVPFNSIAYGITQLQIGSSSTARNLRLTVADQFGAGRPDFTYVARLLYAATVSPASVGQSGGSITITGTGFRQGNGVTVNGVAASVVSCTPTQIVAIAPSLTAAGAQLAHPVAVAVTDGQTAGSSRISAALSYTNVADKLVKISAPAALVTGSPATTPVAVRVFAADGTTPVAGATVSFTVTAGSASLGLCGGNSPSTTCNGTSDSTGLVQTTITGAAAGTIALTATEVSGGATVGVSLRDTDPPRLVTLASTAQWIAAGAPGSWTVGLTAVQAGAPAPAAPVTWTASAGLTLSHSSGATAADGTAAVGVSFAALPPGSGYTVTGCAWTNICATWTLNVVDPSQWQVAATGGGGQNIATGETFNPLTFTVTDHAGHPLPGAPVTIHQRVLAWEAGCAIPGQCASAPVLAAAGATSTADVHGAVAVPPLRVPGQPQIVEVAASSGTAGFVTLTLSVHP